MILYKSSDRCIHVWLYILQTYNMNKKDRPLSSFISAIRDNISLLYSCLTY